MPIKSSLAATRRRIPVTLVTGFLGSGKTTLINAALRSKELAKTVVVVNEFGEVVSTTSFSRAVPTPWSSLRMAAFAAPFEATSSARSTRFTTPDKLARFQLSIMS
jgi:predicted ATPase